MSGRRRLPGFVTVHRNAIHRRLAAGMKMQLLGALMVLLVDCDDDSGEVRSSVRSLADRYDLRRDTLTAHLKELEAMGEIAWVRRPGGPTEVIRLVHHDELRGVAGTVAGTVGGTVAGTESGPVEARPPAASRPENFENVENVETGSLARHDVAPLVDEDLERQVLDDDLVQTDLETTSAVGWHVLAALEKLGEANAVQLQFEVAEMRKDLGRRPVRTETVRSKLEEAGWHGWVIEARRERYALTETGRRALDVCRRDRLDVLGEDAVFDPATGELLGRDTDLDVGALDPSSLVVERERR